MICVEWSTFGDDTTYLYHTNLCDPFNNPNDNESPITEEICKNVQFIFFNFPCVNLVEKLEEDEDLEHESEMKNLLGLVALLKIERTILSSFVNVTDIAYVCWLF